MLVIFWGIAVYCIYVELVYHVTCFGVWNTNPIFMLMTVFTWSVSETILIGLLPGKVRKWFLDLGLVSVFLLGMVQRVYMYIFKQPLLWEAVFAGGQDALTNYWREALEALIHVSPSVLFMLVPCILGILAIHRHSDLYHEYTKRKLGILLGLALIGGAGQWALIHYEDQFMLPEYEAYEEFYDSLSIAQDMGVLPLFQRDSLFGIQVLSEGVIRQMADKTENNLPSSYVPPDDDCPAQDESALVQPSENPNDRDLNQQDLDSSEQNIIEPDPQADEQVIPVKERNEREIDWTTLEAMANTKHKQWLTQYIKEQTPTSTNDYTGIFRGYNLIFLTAEGFSTYAVDEELTPTLYKLVNSGLVFDNYYTPLWQTSTSDGEYINCTGLIPDRQFSMKKSAENEMNYVLPAFFKEDSVCMAYHNNTISYYDRYKSHNNLGYFFKGCMLGGLSKDEWGDHIFHMENPKQWPASDLEMMEATVDEYINEERFLVYYMTVSGHLNYNFRGNAMSCKNKEAVAGLDLGETGRAYIACQIELDKALDYLLKRLEEEGKLENTVICLSTDHIPYAMTEEEYEELAGKDLSQGMDRFRNSLILWNAGLAKETVHIEKACGPMDLLPTLLNLFGFDFDSRMYAGRDIFSENEGLVIFNDRSFVTDSVICRKRNRQTIWLTDENGNEIVAAEDQKEYLRRIEEEVKNRYDFSAYVLQENFYSDVAKAVGDGK